jgi:membrane protease YdiL (CAAX protease family)
LLANVAVTQGLFGGVLAVGAFYFEIPASALGLGGEDLALLAVGVGLGAVLWAGNELAAVLADAVGAGYDETLREMLSPDSGTGWAVLFGVVLPVVALVEEFVFRAAVIGVPAAGFGTPVWALVPVSAGAFALGHGAQGRVGVAVTGGLGLVLAGAYAATGSLLVVVVAHYLVNALEFAVHELLDRPRLWSS